MEIKEFFTMEIDGVENSELIKMKQGITWPALMALNSSFMLENKEFRKSLFILLKSNCNDRGMMPFFINPSLQEKYPPDLESTALFVSACVLSEEDIVTDLDDIKKMIMPNGFFKTWLNREICPIDYTSQLIMSLCYSAAGMKVDYIAEKALKEKFKTFNSLCSRDIFYNNSLYFIYFTLYINDTSLLPNSYKSFIGSFIENYVPADEVETYMIQKICFTLRLTNPLNQIIYRANPIFTNGKRQWIKYHSQAVKEIFRTSANINRKYRFNRSSRINRLG